MLTHEICRLSHKVILLTGTPILNRGDEIFSLMQATKFDSDKANEEYITKVNKLYSLYFNYPYESYMKHILRTTVMIRRKKEDVLPQLPPKRRQIIEIEPDRNLVKCLIEEKKIESLEKNNFEEYSRQANRLRTKNTHFSEIARARHKTALAKLPQLCEFIEYLLTNSGCLIVYAYHLDVIDGIFKKFSDSSVKFTGAESLQSKNDAVQKFQNGKANIFIGSLRAASLGITLTRSSTVLFAELDWTPAINTQAEDRCHRIGQKTSVKIYHFVVNGSIDANIAKRVVEKQNVIDGILS